MGVTELINLGVMGCCEGNDMAELINKINIAESNKPAMGEACNHCGWCCLTEVCQMGEFYLDHTQIPCELLISEGDKHYCSLIRDKKIEKKVLGIGTGCCAMTQKEILLSLENSTELLRGVDS